MENDLSKVKEAMKQKRQSFKKPVNLIKTKKWYEKYLQKTLLVGIITISLLIALKSSKKFSNAFYKQVYDTNFTFAEVNELYQNTFGSPIPFKDLFDDKTKQVFKEDLKYTEANKYKDGVKLTVDDSYLVPFLESGIVIFIGDKEEYGYTVIVQQTNGIDLWYSNLDKVNVKLYDFVEQGNLVGEAKDKTLYLVYQKDGKVIDYSKYLPQI